MTPAPVEPSADGARSSLTNATRSEPAPQSRSFVRGLIGHSPGAFCETVRNSIQLSSRTTRQPDHDVVARPDQGPQPEQRRPCRLLTLPPEILLMVLQCLDFAVIVRLRKISLANFDTVWVCRWCGYPIVEGAAVGCEQMHRSCYKRYNDALFCFFLLGWLQLGLAVVAAALAWKYYRTSMLVFAPTVTSFLLLWLCLGFLVCRGNRRRTYHWTLVLELAILGLWIPPLYYIAATDLGRPRHDPVPRSAQATMAMFALNMLFRLLNVVGNTVLLFQFDATERHRAGAPSWKQPFYSSAVKSTGTLACG